MTVYEPRGQYQLRVTTRGVAGYGALQLAFEKLKQKLQAEGLFAAGAQTALQVSATHRHRDLSHRRGHSGRDSCDARRDPGLEIDPGSLPGARAGGGGGNRCRPF